MYLIALADLPNGVKAGQRFEVPDYQGVLLLRARVARPEDDTPAPPASTRRYRRRDLTPDSESDPA